MKKLLLSLLTLMPLMAFAHGHGEHEYGNNKVFMYTREGCPSCDKAREYLYEHHIPFRECDIENNPRCAHFFYKHKIHVTPLLEVNDHTVPGYYPWLINHYLNK